MLSWIIHVLQIPRLSRCQKKKRRSVPEVEQTTELEKRKKKNKLVYLKITVTVEIWLVWIVMLHT